jgi:hypothetical protein
MKKYAAIALLGFLAACSNKEAATETSATTNVVEKSFGQQLKEKVVKQAVDTAVDEVVDKVADKAKDKAKDKILENLIP